MSGGERRPEQLEMCRAVAEALVTGTHLVVQAGTGTGKSQAYLVPASL
jgi:ATP-dependent DNA helicase DinG